MTVLKLSQGSVQNLLPPPKGEELYFDTEIKGFGVRVTKTGVKSYIYQRTMPGNRPCRVTIGRANILTTEQARKRAKHLYLQFCSGIDPVKEKQKQRILEQQEKDAQQKDRDRRSLTLRVALADFLEMAHLKPKTATDYRYQIERHLIDWLDMPLEDMTRTMVVDKHKQITENVKARSGKRAMVNGRSSANYVMRILRTVWNHARERAEELPENPVQGFRRVWHKEKRRTTYIMPGDLGKFIAAVDQVANPIHRHYVKALLFTGLRRNEAAALQWAEVDFANRLIRLSGNRTKNGRGLDLPMCDTVYNLLHDCERQGRQGKYVFPSATSKSGHIEEPKFAMDKINAICGLHVTCHDLRCTFATVAESCEMSVYALKGLINHSFGGDVTSGYIGSGAERLRQPMVLVEQKLLALINKQNGDDAQTQTNIVPFSFKSAVA